MKNKFSRRALSMLLATVMLLLLLPLGTLATEPGAGTVGVPLGANEAIYSVNPNDDGVTDNVIVAEYNGTSYVMGAISSDGKAAAIPVVNRDTWGNNIIVDEATAELFKVSSLMYKYYGGSYWVYSFLTESGYIVDAYGIGEEEQHKLATAEKESVTLDDKAYLWRFDFTPGWYNWNSSYRIYLTVKGEDIHFELGYGTPEAGTEYIASKIFSKSCQHPNMQYVPAVDPTCKKNGNDAYWYCERCNNEGRSSYFSDEYGLSGSFNPPVALSYGAIDTNHDGVCDDCGKNMPVFKKVTEDSQIVAGGKYLLVTKVGDKYYAAATGTEQSGNQLPAVEITAALNSDGTFTFEGTADAMTIELQFAHGYTEWGNGIRYGFITKFNGSLSEFTTNLNGEFYFTEYDVRGAKYGLYVGLYESGAAEIRSAYSTRDLMRSYTYSEEQLFMLTDMSEDTSYTESPVYLYRLTDTGAVGLNTYEMTAAKSETNYSVYAESGSAAEGGTNVTGLTDAMTQTAINDIVSSFVTDCSISDGERINISTNVKVTVTKYSSENSITFSLDPTAVVSGGGEMNTYEISDSAFDGTPMTVTLYTGGIMPAQIIHEKQDGTKECFYSEWSDEVMANGANPFYELHDNSGNMYVMFTVTEFSDVKLVTKSYEFSNVNVSLAEDITVNYYVVLEEGYTNSKVRFTMNEKIVTVDGELYDAENSIYKFVYTGVAPQNIGDTIYADIIRNDVFVDGKTYSVKEYLEALSGMTAEELEYSEAKYNAMLTLINDLLVYGGAAQVYTGHNTGDLVSSGITGTTFTPLSETDKTASNNGTYITVKSATVFFDSINKIRVRFTADSIEDLVIKVKVGSGEEKELAITNAGEYYYAHTDGIKATGFDDVYTFTAYKGGVAGATITYSIKSYVNVMQNSANAAMAELAKATYNYGLAAKAFSTAE